MARSFAARSPIGRAGAGARARGGRPRRGGEPGRARSLTASAPWLVLSPVLRELAARRRLRLALGVLAVTALALGGGWLWFRHSSFVGAQRIRISGVAGPEAAAIEAALTSAAHGMSTLAPNPSVLEAAVARFPQVSGVRAVPSFPHGLKIIVAEQPPVAALVVSGMRTAVAADGVVLGPSLAWGTLPNVAAGSLPAPGSHLHDPLLLEAAAVLGAVPRPLAGLLSRAYVGPRGLTVAMRNGLLVYFGDATRPHAKWLSLLSVLADPSSAGASYVDVRLPGRPAAGFGSPVASESPAGARSAAKGAGESAVATLAQGLKAATPQPAAPAAESASAASSGEASPGASSGSQPSPGTTGTEGSEASAPAPGG